MFFDDPALRIVVQALNSGFLKTLQLFATTLVGAIPLGLIIAFGSMSRFPPLRCLTKTMVWIIRGTPLMLQLMIIYYVPGLKGFPIWGGGEHGRFLASSVAFIFNYACYFSEIYRGGIAGVPQGQIFYRVTLLQMIKRIVPPMSNEVITLVKDTSLSRIIALQELIWMGESFLKGNQGYSGLVWPLFFTGLYYLIFNGVVTVLLEIR